MPEARGTCEPPKRSGSFFQYGSEASSLLTTPDFRHINFKIFQKLKTSVLNPPSQQIQRELALGERNLGFSRLAGQQVRPQKPQESCQREGRSVGRRAGFTLKLVWEREPERQPSLPLSFQYFQCLNRLRVLTGRCGSCPQRNGACAWRGEYRGQVFRLAPAWVGQQISGSSSLSLGHDEPAILRSPNRQFSLMGADGEHFIKGNAVSYVSSYRGVISIEILDH